MIDNIVVINFIRVKKRMGIIYSKLTDFDAWIALAREVEPLFGPMANEAAFQ